MQPRHADGRFAEPAQKRAHHIVGGPQFFNGSIVHRYRDHLRRINAQTGTFPANLSAKLRQDLHISGDIAQFGQIIEYDFRLRKDCCRNKRYRAILAPLICTAPRSGRPPLIINFSMTSQFLPCVADNPDSRRHPAYIGSP